MDLILKTVGSKSRNDHSATLWARKWKQLKMEEKVWSLNLEIILQARKPFSLEKGSPPEVFLGKGVLKIRNKFTGEDPCQATLLKSFFGMGVLL